MSQHLKPADVAADLQVSVGTVYQWAREGRIPAVRLTGQARGPVRIPQDAYRRWLADQQPANT